LALYTGLPARDVPLRDGARNKPELAHSVWSSRLQFNVSHSNGLVACAFTRYPSLGIDVEHERGDGDVDIDAIADCFFAPHEIADIRAQTAAMRVQRFFTYWTLKEAFLKARGVGLTVPLAEATIALDSPCPRLCEPQDTDWEFTVLRHGAHLIAVAVSTGAPAGQAGAATNAIPISVRSGLCLLGNASGSPLQRARPSSALIPVQPPL
jgi:4'-phosphopantetheinyl transferase